MRTTPKNMFLLLMAVVFALGIILTACEGPSGSQGPQGPDGQQGPEGPIGPAGEDGSVMYAGEGAPAADIGQNGDYYLNQNTGELYGPKDGEGWGNSIIVLMGEDGQDGQNGDDGQDGADGQDGQDGEDGSQIYSGSGTPGGSLGSAGDYYLDQDNYELYGPKTGSGWGTPLNLKGADGNANVTQYIFGEHDFSAGSSVSLDIPGTTVEEMYQSAWLVYLVRSGGNVYSVPGWAVDGLTEYRSYLLHMPANNGTARIVVTIKNGSGEVYAEMRVVRVLANSTEGLSKQKENSIIPDHLDVSDYEAVAEYYGFYR